MAATVNRLTLRQRFPYNISEFNMPIVINKLTGFPACLATIPDTTGRANTCSTRLVGARAVNGHGTSVAAPFLDEARERYLPEPDLSLGVPMPQQKATAWIAPRPDRVDRQNCQ